MADADQTIIDIPAPDGTMPALSAGDPDATAVVVVLHQASGWGPQTSVVLEKLAAEGYWAIAPDLFYRRGDGPVPLPASPDDLPAFDAWLSGDTDVVKDLAAVRDALHARGFTDDRIAVVGYSYGGRAAYLAATRWPFAATALYYAPGVQVKSFAGNTDMPALVDAPTLSPWIAFYGERDHFLTPGELGLLAETAARRGGELVRYPEAGHSFDTEDFAAFDAQDEKAAVDAERRLMAFLREYLGAASSAAR